jgi:hypothetical protein
MGETAGHCTGTVQNKTKATAGHCTGTVQNKTKATAGQ